MQEKLTTREQEILELLLKGFSQKEIAYKLKIRNSTVDYHRSSLYSKLDVHSIQQLFAKYSSNGNGSTQTEDNSLLPQDKKRTPLKLLLTAGIAVLAVSLFFNFLFLVKSSSTKPFYTMTEIKTPLTITLGNHYPWGWKYQIYLPIFYDKSIIKGDIYTFSCSFSSNVDFDFLQVFLQDEFQNGDFSLLSSPVKMIFDIKANTEYSGEVTIIAIKTASNTEPMANLFNLEAYPYQDVQPTLTFTKFEFKKIN